jgi:hypothetical protein
VVSILSSSSLTYGIGQSSLLYTPVAAYTNSLGVICASPDLVFELENSSLVQISSSDSPVSYDSTLN